MKNTMYNIQAGKALVPTAPDPKAVTMEQLRVLASFLQTLEENGYTLDVDALSAVARLDLRQLKRVAVEILDALKDLSLGKTFRCMYEGFPQSVMEADAAALWFGANLHYWSDGTMRLALDSDFAERRKLENNRFRVLQLMRPQEKTRLLHDLLASPTVWPPDQKTWVLENLSAAALCRMLDAGLTIPNHANLSVLAGRFLYKDAAKRLLRTQTDVLRAAAALYLDDPMLEKRDAFPSLPRPARRRLLELLDGVTRGSEDLRRYEGCWKRFSAAVHPAEYPEYSRALQAFRQLWGGSLDRTYHSRLEQAFQAPSPDGALSLLRSRPGEFTRSLSRALRTWPDDGPQILRGFLEIAGETDTPKLLSVLEYVRNLEQPYRVFTPRGGRAPYYSNTPPAPLPEETANALTEGITRELLRRFGEREPLGKVYLDPSLRGLCIPKGQTTTANSLKALARGSRIRLRTGTNVVRGFVFWKNAEIDGRQTRTDIDLSAVLYDRDWRMTGHISYMSLRSDYACHSGDIVDAPAGAAEYIDINLRKVPSRVRYILFPANVFCGLSFQDMEVCSAGWMEREDSDSGEIWEPGAVENQFSIRANTKAVSMFALDAEAREIVWIDRPSSSGFSGMANNVLTRQAAQIAALRAEVERKRLSLYDLFSLHAQARGERTDHPQDADFTILPGGDLNPYDLAAIAGEWL